MLVRMLEWTKESEDMPIDKELIITSLSDGNRFLDLSGCDLADEDIIEIIQILEITSIITKPMKIMKILEILARITKIMKIYKIK